MSFLLWGLVGGFALLCVVGLFFYARYKSMYKYKALIIAQVGDSWVLLQDLFRVWATEDGYYAISFFHQKDIEATSPKYGLWSLFAKSAKESKAVLESDKVKHYTRRELDNILARGAIFKKTSEGSITPAVITDDGDLKVISQDDRAFIANQAKKRAEMSKTKWSTTLPMIAFGATLILLGAMTVFYFVYLNNSMVENIDNICRGVSVAAQSSNVTLPSLPGVGG